MAMTLKIKTQRKTNKKNQKEPIIQFCNWFYLIWVLVTMLLPCVIIVLIAHTFIPLICVIILAYPYLGYYHTCVEFYEDFMVIIRPLFFFKKHIPYNGIFKMRMTKGKGTMVRVYLTDNVHFWSFSPPLLKKDEKKMELFVKSKGIEFDQNN